MKSLLILTILALSVFSQEANPGQKRIDFLKKHLKLSDAQVKQLQTVQKQNQADHKKLKREIDAFRTQMQKKAEAQRSKSRNRVKSILNAQQKAAFDALMSVQDDRRAMRQKFRKMRRENMKAGRSFRRMNRWHNNGERFQKEWNRKKETQKDSDN